MRTTVWDYVADELAERGWTREELARRMGGDETDNREALWLMEEFRNGVTIGVSVGEALATAFGTSSELWANIDESCRLAEQTP